MLQQRFADLTTAHLADACIRAQVPVRCASALLRAVAPVVACGHAPSSSPRNGERATGAGELVRTGAPPIVIGSFTQLPCGRDRGLRRCFRRTCPGWCGRWPAAQSPPRLGQTWGLPDLPTDRAAQRGLSARNRRAVPVLGPQLACDPVGVPPGDMTATAASIAPRAT